MKTSMLKIVAACSLIAIPSMSMAMPAQVKEQAQVAGKNGSVNRIALLKSGKKLETVMCSDFVMVDEDFRPQAVVYAANYGPKGKPHPTVTLDGVESIVPVVVQQCGARPGDHFVSTVKRAMAAARTKK